MTSRQMNYGTGFDQAALAMGAYFRRQPRYEVMGTIFAISWLLGGLFADKSLYLISMIGSVILFIGVLISSLVPSNKLLLYAHNASFRRLIIALIARWGYTTGNSTGPSEMEFMGYQVKINEFADYVLFLLFLVWIITKYGEEIDREGFLNRKSPFLLIRGTLRGIILIGVLWSFIEDNFSETFQFYLLLAYLLEPISYWFFAKLNPTQSSTEMVLGSSRLPMVALRESLFTNFILLVLTMWFNGISGDEWELLRVVYFFASAFIFYTSYEEIKNYKLNPLGNGPLGDFLNDTPMNLSNLDLNEKFGTIINEETKIKMSEALEYNLQPGSILIPLDESKGQISAIVLGKTEIVRQDAMQNISDFSDGITTMLVPKKQITAISKKMSSHKLSTINLKAYKLPNIDELSDLMQLYSSKMGNWVQNIKNELTKFELSNYGITDVGGVTQVNLPGLSITDGPSGTSVKLPGLKVIDTPESSTVRIGSWLTVVDFPNFSMVSLPGIKVLDVPSQGSAVNLMGFKISDNLPTEYLDSFGDEFSKYLDSWEERMDAKLGRVLADQKSSLALTMSWDGDLKPMIGNKKEVMSEQLLLSPSTLSDTPQLPGDISQKKQATEILRIAGLSEEGRTIRRRKSEKSKHLKEDLKMARIDSRRKRKLEKLDRRLERAKKKGLIDDKIADIEEKMDQIKTEISDSESKSTNKSFKSIIDVDYEIVDDDENDTN